MGPAVGRLHAGKGAKAGTLGLSWCSERVRRQDRVEPKTTEAQTLKTLSVSSGSKTATQSVQLDAYRKATYERRSIR